MKPLHVTLIALRSSLKIVARVMIKAIDISNTKGNGTIKDTIEESLFMPSTR